MDWLNSHPYVAWLWNSNAWKKPGRAYIEIDSGLHGFVVGDDVHPQCEEIYRKLDALTIHLKVEGHVWFY